MKTSGEQRGITFVTLGRPAPATSAVTQIRGLPGHSLTVDSGWREVCDTALNFVKRFV